MKNKSIEINKPTVLIVHNYYQIPGGEDTVVANEMKMLQENGHKVILYSRNNTELKTMGKMKKLLLPFTTIFNIRSYREIKSIIKNENIDIVHVHNTLNLISPSVYYAAKRSRIPVVQTIHNFRLMCMAATFYRDGHICEDCLKEGLACAVKHSCYRGSKAQTLACVLTTFVHRLTGIYGNINYICLTEFNKQKLLNIKQIRPEKVYVKPNFVESIGEFIPGKQREDNFVFAGRLDKLKGIDILLKAWQQMGKKAPKLTICGTGPMEDWCKKYVYENKLNVELLGFVPNEKARKIIASSKALILPTQWYEGFPMSMVEAFSVGTPVLCSDIGNSGSLVEEGINGYKFLHDDSEDIAKAVLMLDGLNDSTKKVYDDKYTKEINYGFLNKIYLEIMHEEFKNR